MIALIIRTIEMSIGMSGGDFQLSKAELTRFYKQGGARLAANTSARKQAAGSAEDAPRKASSSDNTTVAPLANMIRTDSEQRAQAPVPQACYGDARHEMGIESVRATRHISNQPLEGFRMHSKH